MKTEGNQKLGLDDYVIGLDKKKYSLKEVRELRKNKVIISEYDLNKNKNLNIAANFASFLQHNTNKIIERLINKNFDNDIPLVVSGGTFANVLVNGILNKQFDFFVCPPMGDEGLSLGAAAWGAYINGFTHLDLNTLYLGYNAGTNFNKANPNQIAKLLKKSKIIGLIEGNMEFGPRALGARSILAEPSDYGKNYSINKRLNRVEYMPFAPVILKEFANEILEGWSEKHKSSKHMTLTYKVHPKWVKKLKGVVHKDGTVRPQVIDKTDNKFYYSIVYAFFKLTGIPVLINTSFNRHGEPMVRTHKEAIDVLKNKKIDHLISNGKIY